MDSHDIEKIEEAALVEAEAAEVEEALRPTLARRLAFIGLGGILLLIAVVGIVTGGAGLSINLFDLLFLLIGGKLATLGVNSLPLLEWNEEGITDRTSLLGADLFVPWSDIDSVTTGEIHSGVRLNLKEHPRCFAGVGPGRMLQRLVGWFRGFRGIEINPSFMRLDYRRLGRLLDELVLDAQVRELRAGLADEAERSADEIDEGGARGRLHR